MLFAPFLSHRPNVCIYNETYEVMTYSYAYRQLVCFFRRFCL